MNIPTGKSCFVFPHPNVSDSQSLIMLIQAIDNPEKMVYFYRSTTQSSYLVGNVEELVHYWHSRVSIDKFEIVSFDVFHILVLKDGGVITKQTLQEVEDATIAVGKDRIYQHIVLRLAGDTLTSTTPIVITHTGRPEQEED